jgi:hypothetical protein
MTRKDYVLLAQALKESRTIMLGSRETVDAIAAHLAIVLKTDNHAFDPDRFVRAVQGQ